MDGDIQEILINLRQVGGLYEERSNCECRDNTI